MEGGKLQLSQGDGRIVLRADFGLQVTYDGDWAMIATVPSSYFGSTCGLCGNFNGDVEDDAAYANDTRASSGGAWMGSWKVEDGDPACEECQGLCELCQPTQRQLFGDEEHCGLLQLPEGPFRDCHTATDPTGPFDTCLTKLCLAGGEQQMLCQELEKYAATCRHHGATIGDWRTLSGCGKGDGGDGDLGGGSGGLIMRRVKGPELWGWVISAGTAWHGRAPPFATPGHYQG